MVQVPILRHRELGELEPEKEDLPHSLPRVPGRVPDTLWQGESICEDTILGHEVLADHSNPLRVLQE